MSQSLLPWIATYFVDIAEQHGADIFAVPEYTRNKKVQIVEFLTYGEIDQDNIIWAKVSDKEHTVSVRFTQEAVQECTNVTGKRLTQYKHAVITIKNFKPFFARVPLGNNKKMTSDAHLAFECRSLSILGGSSENVFGRPKSLSTNAELAEWVGGLRQHGGAGNVLKDRRLKKLEEEKKQIDADFGHPTSVPTSVLCNASENNVPQEPSEPKAAKIRNKSHQGDPVRRYHHAWRAIIRDALRAPPSEIAALLRDIPVEGDAVAVVGSSPKRRRIDTENATPSPSPTARNEGFSSPGTAISGWDTTPSRRSPAPLRSSLIESFAPFSQTKTFRSSKSPSLCSSPIQSSPKPIYPDASNLLSPKPLSHLSSPVQPARREPSSSPPPHISTVVVSDTVLTAPSPQILKMPWTGQAAIIRRIPRPPEPLPPNSSGPVLTLVPNSDTSGTTSQSQSHTRHSQSQTDSQDVQNTQSVVLSQLSALNRPPQRPDSDALDKLVEGEDDLDSPQHTPNEHDSLFDAPLTEDDNFDGDRSDHETSSLNGGAQRDFALTNLHLEQTAQAPTPPNASSSSLSIGQSEEVIRKINQANEDKVEPESTKVRDSLITDEEKDIEEIADELESDDNQTKENLATGNRQPSKPCEPISHVSQVSRSEPATSARRASQAEHSEVPSDSEKQEAAGIHDRIDLPTSNVVQHNADAWRQPTFMRNRYGTKSVVKTSKPAAPFKKVDKLVRGTSGKQPAGQTRPRAARPYADRNAAPLISGVGSGDGKQRNAGYEVDTEQAEKAQLERKRSREDDDADEELPANQNAKKRKMDATSNNLIVQKNEDEEVLLEDTANRKLNGFKFNLDRIVLAQENRRLMSWEMLANILLLTGQDRRIDNQ